MKPSAVFLLVIGAGIVSSFAQESWSPTYPTLERYRATWEKSPFDRDTVASVQPSFAEDYALTGISRIGDDWTILLVDRKTRKYLPISSSDKNSELKIVEVFPNSDRRQAKVKIAKGKQEAILNFDPNFNQPIGGKKAKPNAQPEAVEVKAAEPPPKRLKLRIPKKDEAVSKKPAG
tara:strand:- start:5863 stop:6390 length:528 start_codon:yes stop_codon:yes gene_type:complete